jgi:Transposase DNA-binding/Transposase Tn5 dimerisation domain
MQVDLSLELKYLDLSHKRRNARFSQTVSQLVNNPDSSIPQAACNWADIKGIYRFFSNKQVSASAINQCITKATGERCQSYDIVLSVQDTTNVHFSSCAEGLGYLDHGRGNGFMVHSAMAIDNQGCPLGLLHQKIWARDKKTIGKTQIRADLDIVQKESYKWLEGIEASEALLKDNKCIIHIADREADIYELFTMPRAANSEILIRATHERKTLLGNTIWKEIDAEQIIAHFDIEVENPASGLCEIIPMVVKTGMVILSPPKKKPQLPAILLYGIIVTESNPKTAKPIEWRLISSIPAKDKEQALELIKYYTYRWRIERFHYILKSGCNLEELQLRDADALHRATLTYCLCAFKLMQVLYQSRILPTQPCSEYFTKMEWLILAMVHYKRRIISKQPLSLKLAVTVLAKLGGYIGRKNDGPPGIKNIWRGMNQLHGMVTAFEIHQLNLSTF